MAQALESLEAQPDGLDPYSRLARYVQESPGRIHEPPGDLAERFGVPQDFVAEVQASIGDRAEPISVWQSITSAAHAIGAVVKSVWRALTGLPVRVWLKITEKPLRFVLLSGLGFLLIYFISNPSGLDRQKLLDNAMGALFMLVFASHLACFARHGNVRTPLIAVAALAPGLLAIGLSMPLDAGGAKPSLLQAAAYALLLTLLYAVSALAASVIGGVMAMRLAQRRESKETRQDQLDRLFTLEKSFLQIVRARESGSWAVNWVTKVRRWAGYPLVAFLAGTAFGILVVVVVGGMQKFQSPGSSVLRMLEMFMVPLGLAVFSSVGYFAGGVRHAIASLLVSFCGFSLGLAVPLGSFGPEFVVTIYRSGEALILVAGLTVLGVLMGLASKVEAQALRTHRLDQNDPVALFSEILRLQWKLRPASLATSVMVVDVARSTAMKNEADPLKIEYSFRAYQDLVSKVATENGGTVVSRAGDGAVVTFPETDKAIRAAKAVQTAMPEFNQSVNLLNHRFMLRIGIHSGKTNAGLEEVPFNELIDIAAHVERVSPVGGIALTEAAAQSAPEEPTLALQDPVDGQAVRIVLNPVLEG